MYFHIIASGSKGNATIIVSNKTVILIDMGIAFCRLEEGLKEIGLNVNDIDAALFTHDHTDHISGLRFLSPKKLYALEGTLPSLSNVVEVNKQFLIKEVKITPVKISHDAKNPCGYILEDNKSKLVYITDTGVFPDDIIENCKNPDYILLESNHNISMLMKTKRPQMLKDRIMSEKGHLCNEDSAYAALSIMGKNTKEIVLMHISEEANTPETAIKDYKTIFDENNVSLDNIKLSVANQWHSLTGGDYEN